MVCAHCDNGAVVEIVYSGKAKDPLLAHQLRAPFYLCAFFEFDISAVHTPGQQNGAAHAISCNNTEAFLSQGAVQGVSGGATGSQQSQTVLEVARLDVLVHRLLNSALAPSTIHAYTSARTRYAEFCSVTQLPLLPLTESGLCRFSAWLAGQNVSVRTILILFVSAVLPSNSTHGPRQSFC